MKWEYKTVFVDMNVSLDDLNKLGAEGWEAIGMVHEWRTTSHCILLKREIKNV